MAFRKYYLLYPFSLAYELITDIRNLLYDSGILPSVSFDKPVISVGNITVGGTGKTPHTEYIAEILRKTIKVAVLSRGYGRKTTGYLEAMAQSSAFNVGDEPLQLATNIPDILVAVDGDRVSGVRTILQKHPETGVVILDDAFQHRRIKAGLSVLLTDYNRLISRDSILPTGRLRERWTNCARADIVIVTKSPAELTGAEMDALRKELKIRDHQKLFFTTYTYSSSKPVFDINAGPLELTETERSSRGVILLTGIASPEPLKIYLEKYFCKIIHLKYPDHHYFDDKDLKRIGEALDHMGTSHKLIITTSKDAVRLRELGNVDPDLKKNLYYIPVRVNFLNGGNMEFGETIYKYAGKDNTNNRIPEV
jgi:tetraacyldisaccharide 4'-kinase